MRRGSARPATCPKPRFERAGLGMARSRGKENTGSGLAARRTTMPRIENWHQAGNVVFGNIFDDEQGRFPDGEFIRTSRIPEGGFRPDKDEVQTKNTLYKLGKPAKEA